MGAPAFTKTVTTFSMTCKVSVNIRTRADTIWHLLTDAQGFPRWNSTITRIEGVIREGERLRLHVPATNRTFTPRVSGVVQNERMTWSDGFALLFRGVRTFTLVPCPDSSTDFAMEERFSGLLLPLLKRMLPDFQLKAMRAI